MKLQSFLLRSVLFFLCLLLSLLPNRSHAQGDTNANGIGVSGKVTDEAGKPVAGVSVQVKGSSGSTISKDDGTFKLTVPGGTAVLIFTHVEYELQEVPLNNQSTLTVSLQSSKKTLDDVVVIGYGTQKKRNV